MDITANRLGKNRVLNEPIRFEEIVIFIIKKTIYNDMYVCVIKLYKNSIAFTRREIFSRKV